MRTPTDRASRLLAIRREIASGTYETPEKAQAAVDGLLDDVFGIGRGGVVRPEPSFLDRVHAKLQRMFGWQPGENWDHLPPVHTDYSLPSPPVVTSTAGGEGGAG